MNSGESRVKLPALILVAATLIVALWWFRHDYAVSQKSAAEKARPNKTRTASTDSAHSHARAWRTGAGSSFDPAAIVADKVALFAQSRRDFARTMAQRRGMAVPPEVEAFFDAVAANDWDRIEKTFAAMNGGAVTFVNPPQRTPEVQALWPAIHDAFGAAEQAHLWPPDKLLDYGYEILDSLRPGMVYVGGTDSGSWIPELVNEGEKDRHIVITQNALADSTYLDYLRLQYDGQITVPTGKDSEAMFSQYIEDAQKRLEHDQKFPNEPKQLLPTEDVRVENGKIAVSGQTAVMAINEKILKVFLEKNPEMSFGLSESFPLKSTYEGALPLGPLFELRAEGGDTLSPERAAAAVEVWQTKAKTLLSDLQTAEQAEIMKTYSHDAVATANFLAARNLGTQAEEAYRIAAQICPYNPEAAASLAKLLKASGRSAEGQQILDAFIQKYPDQRKTIEGL